MLVNFIVGGYFPEASTDGEERFWLVVMRYKEDSGNWNGRTVSARYSASGEYLGQT